MPLPEENRRRNKTSTHVVLTITAPPFAPPSLDVEYKHAPHPPREIKSVILSLVALLPATALWFPTNTAAQDENTTESYPSVKQIHRSTPLSIDGKEVDFIEGDYLIENDQILVVIAVPGKNRDANMTTRGVGGGVIDLTRRDIQSDQLTAIYPGGGRYNFHDDSLVEIGKLDDGGVFWQCQSSSSVADNGTTCSVVYTLRPQESFLTMTVTIEGDDVSMIKPGDGIRADRTFKFSRLGNTSVAFCEDEYFRQTYGILPTNGKSAPRWGDGRPKRISYTDAAELEDDKQTLTWSTKIYPASSSLDLWGLIQSAATQTFRVEGATGDQPRIKLSVVDGDIGSLRGKAIWRSDRSGVSIVHLPPGDYRVRAEAIGHESVEQDIVVGKNAGEHTLKLGPATIVSAKISDEAGGPIPCKVSFYGVDAGNGEKTASPDFGLDSQDGSVGNTVYSVDGRFIRSIPPGIYDVVISHGPEFDAVFQKLTVKANVETPLQATLKRVVDTTGWVSAELHSHSSPSGDNTSSQLGRVENLVCEQLEFAPCTEHQRVESYDDQLSILKATQYMATCSGMELTGQPLPINHQNAFPIKLDPHAQDGGGPRTSGSPETQIARLAMWDDNSDKIVQTNHPNMRQLIHDRDLDGKPDGGFSKMLDFMDVIEVHPPQDIFRDLASFKDDRARDRSRMVAWMELIKSGRQIPGVVNTDAHYNWHGSGWLRNWVRSSTDTPSEITVAEMIESLEAGRIIMSTGPFMNVQLHHPDLQQPAQIGDMVSAAGDAELEIRVQCPNWLDVNRVEVFVDGEMQPELSRTRASHTDLFGSDVVKFDQRLPIELRPGSFIIVAAIGEKMTLGRVMGEQFGKRPPVVVSNPIYVSK